MMAVAMERLKIGLPCNRCGFMCTKPYIKEFAKSLFNEIGVDELNCCGLVETEILAKKILSFLSNEG